MLFGGYRYVPNRRIAKNIAGARIPRLVETWATLYHAGFTLRRIALDTGWVPGRRRQAVGAFSPSGIRRAFKEWGVELRKPGGRGSTGGSVLVRLAELERRMAEQERASTQ